MFRDFEDGLTKTITGATESAIRSHAALRSGRRAVISVGRRPARAQPPFGTADGSWLTIIQGTPIRSICALASSGSGR
jgi:hypothetical protein